MAEFYYNTSTGQVEEGKRSTWTALMGPYPTREEAEHALESAHARSQEFDRRDPRWVDEED